MCESILQLRKLLGLVGPLIFEFPFESLFIQHEIIVQRKKKELHSTFVLRAMHSWALKHFINLLFFFSQMKGRFNYLSVALLSSPK